MPRQHQHEAGTAQSARDRGCPRQAPARAGRAQEGRPLPRGGRTPASRRRLPVPPGPQPRPRPANRRCWPPRGQPAISGDSACERNAPGRALASLVSTGVSTACACAWDAKRTWPRPPACHSQPGPRPPPVTHCQVRSRRRFGQRLLAVAVMFLWFLRSSGSANRVKCTDGKSSKRMEERAQGQATSRPPCSEVSRCHRGAGGLPRGLAAPAPLCGSTLQMQDKAHVDPGRRGARGAPRSPAGPTKMAPEWDTLLRT